MDITIVYPNQRARSALPNGIGQGLITLWGTVAKTSSPGLLEQGL